MSALTGLLITGLLFLSGTLALAAGGPPTFAFWDTKAGLPQNTVQSIAQTRDGYIWFTTNDGLVRFDGVRFKIFKKSNTPEMRTNRLFQVMVDEQDRLWILPEDLKSVIKYESGRFKSFTAGKDFKAGDIREPFREGGSMHFRAKGSTYIYLDGRFQETSKDACPELKVWFSEEHQELIVEGKPYRTGASEKSNPSIVSKSITESQRFDRKAVRSVDLPSGTWFLCPVGPWTVICRFKSSRLSVSRIALSFSAYVEKDRFGNLWFGDVDGKFGRIPPEEQIATEIENAKADFEIGPKGDYNMPVRKLFLDREENFWIGTDVGLRFLKPPPLVTVLSERSGLPSENIYAIAEDREGAVWFGVWKDHLARYFKGKIDLYQQGIVSALQVDREGRLWSGSSLGAMYFSNGKWTQLFYKASASSTYAITAIVEGRDGAMWFGSNKELLKLSEGKETVFTNADGMPGNDITSLLESRSGAIWVGTSGGLARIEGGRITSFTEKDGLSSGFVRALYEDEDGTLWIGTYDSGLIRYKDGRFVNIRNTDGLFGDGVFCILEDDGWFWISNNQGIYRVRRDELNEFAEGRKSSVFSASYGQEDGLVNVEANGGKQPAGIKSRDGRLWFATAGGVAIIDPKEAYGEQKPPAVRIEEFAVDNNPPMDAGKEIRIQPGQGNLEINYTAFDYNNATRIQFRYKLEGLDDDWTNAKSRRTAYLSHLPYGDYTLRVAAANRNGVWDESGATVRIIVVRPFYRTNWFYGLLMLSAVAIFATVYVLRIRQLKRINDARTRFTRRLIETQENERQRIALELHDSIGQSLVVIRNRALMGLRKPEDRESILDQMQEISDASAAALQETREIAHNLHPYQIQHLGLTAALNSLFDSVESSSEIGFDRNIQEIGEELEPDTAINIYRIAQESVNNIVKHSRAKTVSVDLVRSDDRLILTIADDGRGFDSTVSTPGLGLKGISERAEIIGGELNIASKVGKGTRLRLYIPFKPNSDGEKETNTDSR